MDVSYMREKIASAYDAKTWKDRCYYQMSNNQVVAIYFSMKEKGVFNKRKPKRSKLYSEQISMWDVYEGVMKETLNG